MAGEPGRDRIIVGHSCIINYSFDSRTRPTGNASLVRLQNRRAKYRNVFENTSENNLIIVWNSKSYWTSSSSYFIRYDFKRWADISPRDTRGGSEIINITNSWREITASKLVRTSLVDGTLTKSQTLFTELDVNTIYKFPKVVVLQRICVSLLDGKTPTTLKHFTRKLLSLASYWFYRKINLFHKFSNSFLHVLLEFTSRNNFLT